ncbi:Hypothetical protein SRAE_1000325400 [Strongyloides ratti]|uniref:Uncharacterized protein n=1 Tax=Strongyloides ratti TaxID=34506 RepID=A0A090L5C1_STRRB|nr:Hypothetical protein SRAE_1000325400 [Strongyloides ratti]CEF65001.1 Hypothetical protein SRAE_1000325400 [Strongyloides ratti]
MVIIFINFLLLYNFILTNQEYIKIIKYPKILWKFEKAVGYEIFNRNLTIQEIDKNNYIVENPETEICRKSFNVNGNMKGKCERGGSSGEKFNEIIETYKKNYLVFKCEVIVYGNSENKNLQTDNFSISLTIQPKEKEVYVHKKNSTENFYIKCHKNPIIKAEKTTLFDDYNNGLQGTTEYLVTDEDIWIEIYFFQLKKEILENIKVICYYEYEKYRDIGKIEITHTFEITNVDGVSIENDKWESFRPKVIEEVNFECDLIGKYYSMRSSIWLKQLYVDKGIKVKDPQWKQVAKHGDPDFEFSSTRLVTKIRLKKDSMEGMPNNVHSVWRLAFFTNAQDDIQCLLTFATPLTEGSDEKINIIKSVNDSMPVEMSCGEINNLPFKWYHEDKLIEEEKINSENSPYSSISNKLILKGCNEITMGSYMIFSQSDPSIFCHFSYECVDKYYRIEDLEKMYKDKINSYKDPKTLYNTKFEEYGIDKNDDPYLIYRPSNKINEKWLFIWKNPLNIISIIIYTKIYLVNYYF